jgi:hypothetical protein
MTCAVIRRSRPRPISKRSSSSWSQDKEERFITEESSEQSFLNTIIL